MQASRPGLGYWLLSALALSAGAGWGCSSDASPGVYGSAGTPGGISGNGAGGSSMPGTGGSSAMPGTSGSGGGVITPLPPGKAYGPNSGRRLTRTAYLNTIADVFGQAAADAAAAVPSAADLDADPPNLVFRNDVAGRVIKEGYVTGYDEVALAVATSVGWDKLAPYYATCSTDKDAKCQDAFVSSLGRTMYRRPLTPAEVTNLAAIYGGPNDPKNADPTPFQTGSRLVVQAMLMSPNFLYQIEVKAGAQPTAPTPFELATRLSLLLWNSGPDGKLLDAAAAGKLAASTDVTAQVAAMVADQKARRGVRGFTEEWLGIFDTPKRPVVGSLTSKLLVDMRNETLRFVERVALDDKADLMQLFTDKKTEVSPDLAKLYGLTPGGTSVYDLSSNPNRAGLLTQPAVLGARLTGYVSLGLRGHWVLNNILCRDVPPPDPAALAIAVQVKNDLPKTATDRDFFEKHETFGPACQGCHSQMDNLGYPFVNYDVAGAYSTKDENGNMLRSDGKVMLDGTEQAYTNAVDFSALLSKSAAVEACIVQKFVQYTLGRTRDDKDPAYAAVYDADTAQLESVVAGFRQQGRTFPGLVTHLATSPLLQAPAADMFQ